MVDENGNEGESERESAKPITQELIDKLERMAFICRRLRSGDSTTDKDSADELMAAVMSLRREVLPELVAFIQLLCDSRIMMVCYEEGQKHYAYFVPKVLNVNAARSAGTLPRNDIPSIWLDCLYLMASSSEDMAGDDAGKN